MQNVVDVLSKDLEQILFPPERKLIPNLDEVYELELALFENYLLTDEELLGNSAYFARVGRDCTHHFLMC
ncbi:MAG: hypothetical protein U9Q05_12820, partial [Thermodesulfobacteriota bacterium]|nr:hypothetical protein [Thermodesulfobacteriota bacterium]